MAALAQAARTAVFQQAVVRGDGVGKGSRRCRESSWPTDRSAQPDIAADSFPSGRGRGQLGTHQGHTDDMEQSVPRGLCGTNGQWLAPEELQGLGEPCAQSVDGHRELTPSTAGQYLPG